jgi:hypothetical protein
VHRIEGTKKQTYFHYVNISASKFNFIFQTLRLKFVYMEKFRKLTSHDLAFGIGRKATKEELEELLNRPKGIGKPIEQVMEDIKKKLADRKFRKAS